MRLPCKTWFLRKLPLAMFALWSAWFLASASADDPQSADATAKQAKSATTGESKATDDADAKVSPLATAGPKPEPITPPEPAKIASAIDRGVQFLLDDQRPDGSWGSPEKTKGLNIYAPAPGSHDAFRVAVTSLAVMALIDARPAVAKAKAAAVDKAIDRGENWLVANVERLRRASLDAVYNVWGHSYAIQALVRLHARASGDAERQAKLKKLAAEQAEMLARNAFKSGGWAYYDHLAKDEKDFPLGSRYDAGFSFCTATALIALHEAKAIGVAFPEEQIETAIKSIHRQRKPDFSYAYGEYLRMYPMLDINRPASSLGRSQACNLALRLYGDPQVTDAVLETWLDRLFARNGWLSVGRKRPVPHESWFQVAGYFYYYGHWYAAMCIEQLPAEKRKYFQDHLAHILLPLQEKDGCWWDYPFYNYHQQYGTAMAVMALVRCQSNWKPRG
jgi:hypothetical protein